MRHLPFSICSPQTRRQMLRVAFAAGLQCVGSVLAAPASHPDTASWEDLIATDLSNVNRPKGSWELKDGVLAAKTHDTLWTQAAYGNFVLDFEFKVAKESNSGVFLRAGDTKNALSALEVQVHESQDGALYGMVGAIYNAQPPSKPMQKPVGEWNRFTVTCNDNTVSLIFNGEEVWDVDLENWKEARKNPDGTPNKFANALKDFARKGPIGLQGLHGKAQAPVWYRNIKVKVLP